MLNVPVIRLRVYCQLVSSVLLCRLCVLQFSLFLFSRSSPEENELLLLFYSINVKNAFNDLKQHSESYLGAV